jgi:small subunit ribosomal protein S17
MPNSRRRLVGRVVSNKMDKTVVVAIERRKLHPIYKKVVRLTKKVMAHDESNSLEIGALVRVVESKPLSRHKRWVVEEVLQAEGAPVLEALADEAGLIEGAPDLDADVEEVEDEEGDEADDSE